MNMKVLTVKRNFRSLPIQMLLVDKEKQVLWECNDQYSTLDDRKKAIVDILETVFKHESSPSLILTSVLDVAIINRFSKYETSSYFVPRFPAFQDNKMDIEYGYHKAEEYFIGKILVDGGGTISCSNDKGDCIFCYSKIYENAYL